MATLDEAELEAMNRASADGIDDADRVLVELDGGTANRVKRRAWEFDGETNVILNELVRYALIHYEDALDLHEP